MGNTKCSHPDCARDSTSRFLGTGVRGVKSGGNLCDGLPYCNTHYQQMLRVGATKTVNTNLGPYRQGVEDCATIADQHGYLHLAKLLRSLNVRRGKGNS